ncbi:hypothetical protein HYV50_04735 [Candidatus Pacearchaeota archaeon]|nr:hypothetical protein [Candidatus Pacearchaeota archaeon]
MNQKNLWVFLVSALVLLFAGVQSVNAFGDIVGVEVNGVNALTSGIDLANFAGDRVPVLVVFKATGNAEDVQIRARISGEREVESGTFDVLANRTYSKVVYLDVPFDLDENLDESRNLRIEVDSRNQGTADEVIIDFTLERESDVIEILSVNMRPEVKAGEPLVIDVVLKNRGRDLAEDNFVVVKVPELGLETRSYLGDLSAVDQSDPDKEDTVERRVLLRIPLNVKSGVYTLRLAAFNDDSFAETERKFFVASGEEDTVAVSSSRSRTFSLQETGQYKMTIVNRGNVVKVFELVVDAPTELQVDVSDPLVVVPAGSSATVEFDVSATEQGRHSFDVNVHSEDGALVSKQTFSAVVKGEGRQPSVASNTTVLLTVILAIIFVVLLVVLIVLLTRKPEKSEEAESSYY